MNEDTKGLDIFALVPAADDSADAGKRIGEIGPPPRPLLEETDDEEFLDVAAKPVRTPARRKKLTTLHLTSYTCRWPIGDPVQPDFHYCGALPLQGRNYCEKHEAMSMQPSSRRRAAS